MEFTHTSFFSHARTPCASIMRIAQGITMSISVDSTEAQVTAAIQNENDSYLTSGYYDRTAKKVSHFKVLRDLNNIRIAKGMQFLRVKDSELIQDKLNLIADIHEISNDEFSRSNLCPVLNNTIKSADVSDDMREFEAVQSLYTLFGV